MKFQYLRYILIYNNTTNNNSAMKFQYLRYSNRNINTYNSGSQPETKL